MQGNHNNQSKYKLWQFILTENTEKLVNASLPYVCKINSILKFLACLVIFILIQLLFMHPATIIMYVIINIHVHVHIHVNQHSPLIYQYYQAFTFHAITICCRHDNVMMTSSSTRLKAFSTLFQL